MECIRLIDEHEKYAIGVQNMMKVVASEKDEKYEALKLM